MAKEAVEKQARALAIDNRIADPSIERIYWFPDEKEVRLVETTPVVPRTDDGAVHPFYFRADPSDDLPVPTGIALIRPQEVGKLRLPKKWGGWRKAVALD